MFKWFLCLILILSCGSLGMMKAQSYSQRLTELSDLKDMIRMLRTEMQYRKDPLPTVFIRIASYKENRSMELLERCIGLMKENMEFKTCWEKAADLAYRGSCLTETDLAVIKDLGLQLGKSDIQGHAGVFSLTEAKLEAQIQEASEEKKAKGKMYRGLGFSAGILIAVILI